MLRRRWSARRSPWSAQYRVIKAGDCLPLPAGITAAEGASCFVNPLTSLSMVETMRREGRTALVHAAAASILGQMLNRLCLKDGVGLVNIVRSAEQANLLRGMERSLVAEQAMKGWLAPPSSGTALKRTAEWASAIFTAIRSAALLVVGPQLPQAGTASSTLVSRPTRRSSASSSAMVASLGAAAGQLIPRSYVAISVNSNSSSWAFSVIRQYSKSVNGHA